MAWLNLADAKDGTRVMLDGGFTCVEAGESVIHCDEEGSPYFKCREGFHYLSGQCEFNDDGDNSVIGVSPL